MTREIEPGIDRYQSDTRTGMMKSYLSAVIRARAHRMRHAKGVTVR